MIKTLLVGIALLLLFTIGAGCSNSIISETQEDSPSINADKPSPDTYLPQITIDDSNSDVEGSEHPGIEIDENIYPNTTYTTPDKTDNTKPNTPDAAPGISIYTESNIPDFSIIENGNTDFAGWEDFIDNGLHSAAYSGSLEWEVVSYSDFDAAAECDIDGDGENELILRYTYQALDYGDMEITDFAYIILKNVNGYPVMIADIWNSGGAKSNTLRYNGKNLFIATEYYALVAYRCEVSVYSDSQFVKYFRYTDLGDFENIYGINISITEEDGVKHISMGGFINEIYLGGRYATWFHDPSASSYEELVALINEIESYPIVGFKYDG